VWSNVFYSCFLQGQSKSGERTVVISLKDGERKYLSGHVVDGRNLFPATGYLVSSRMQYLIYVFMSFQFVDVTLPLFYFPNRKRVVTYNFVIHEHNTRGKYDLHTQFCNTFLFQKSVINKGVKLYNYLPPKIKKLENSNRFRKEVKLALLSNLFYLLEDFLQAKSLQ
jgi:hypothetical protein